MRSGSDIAIDAMKRELVRLQKIADKAKKDSEEYMSVGSEMIAIHQEFAAIVRSKEHGQHVIDKLEKLKTRREKVDKIRAKDFMKLIDKEHKSKFEVENLQSEIFMAEFRNRKRN